MNVIKLSIKNVITAVNAARNRFWNHSKETQKEIHLLQYKYFAQLYWYNDREFFIHWIGSNHQANITDRDASPRT